MRFVPVKDSERQSILMLHRVAAGTTDSDKCHRDEAEGSSKLVAATNPRSCGYRDQACKNSPALHLT
jgi:hypothetical protein